jgi:predicted unusual protein kinase regulating ubiquinone biosynthesis (AarF/ABC1/UbiB family)
MRRHPEAAVWPEGEASPGAVEETLAAFGIGGADRRRTDGAHGRHGDAEVAPWLRAALEALGPTARCFGRYLSMRLDLVETPFWLELGQIEDRAAAVAPRQVAAWIERELSDRPEDVFAAVEDPPLASAMAFQTHRARLMDGRPVVVKVRRPGIEQRLLGAGGLLRALREPLGVQEIDRLIAEFGEAMARHLDLAAERRALECAAEDAAGFDWMVAGKPIAELCTDGLLVAAAVEGPTLAEVLGRLDADGGSTAYCAGVRIVGAEAARLLCAVWLQQVLFGRAFTADPAAERIVFARGGQLSIGGDSFASFEPTQRENLWHYLLAAVSDDPGTAGRYLVKEMTGPAGPESEVALERRFRQLVPFRDGGWNAGDAQVMTHEMFCQWRAASRLGFVPRRSLTPFYTGFARVAMLARRLAPEVDAMREATRDLRLAASCAQLFGRIQPPEAADWMRQYAQLALVMPKGMEEVLGLGLDRDRRGRTDEPYRTEHERRSNSLTIAVALLAVFAAANLLVHAGGGPGTWREAAPVAGMAIAGALLVAAIARME